MPQVIEALCTKCLASLFHIVKLTVDRFGLSRKDGLACLRLRKFAPCVCIAARMQDATTCMFFNLRIGAIPITDHYALKILQVRIDDRMLMRQRPMEYIVGS